MRTFKRFFWLIVFLIVLNIGISIWVLAHDLKTRFPGIDFSKAKFGVASWYSETDKHINERTANNEKFDDQAMTCASWDYPFGKRLVVINIMNGKWVVCRVNDRGPAKHLRREVDLTKAAFQKIENPRRGLIYATVIPIPRHKTRHPSSSRYSGTKSKTLVR